MKKTLKFLDHSHINLVVDIWELNIERNSDNSGYPVVELEDEELEEQNIYKGHGQHIFLPRWGQSI